MSFPAPRPTLTALRSVTCPGGNARAAALLLGALLLAGSWFPVAASSSANYAIQPATFDSGSGSLASGNYQVESETGQIGSIAMASTGSAIIASKGGFAGQLYELVGFAINASPATLQENRVRQIIAGQTLDDGTLLALDGALVDWSIVDGPLMSISADGLVTAGSVDADTFATVRGVFSGQEATFVLTVLDGLALDQVKGSYAGLISQDPLDYATSGLLRVRLLGSGAYTATIALGKSRFVIRGKFDSHGLDHRTFKLPDGRLITVDLSLDLTGGDQVSGTVSDGSFTSGFVLDRALYSAKNAVPDALQGRFTILARHESADTDAPQGDGFARLTIRRSGSVSVSGTLADGAPFAQSTFLSKQASWPLYVALYGHKGALIGLVQHAAVPTSDLASTVSWSRPAMPKDSRFGGGFDTTLQWLGARYTPPPPGIRALDFADALENGEITLDEGGLAGDATATFTLSAKNTITVKPPNPYHIILKLKPNTGLYTGSFLVPGARRTTPIRGALIQKDPLGYGFGGGFFLGPIGSGSADLTPSP